MKRRLISAVRRAALRHGYEITPIWHLRDRALASHLRSIFQTYAIDCVIDVGANRGQYRDLLREEVGYPGLILSFEPVRRYANELAGRADKDPKWKIFPYALGGCITTAKINVTRSPGLNSFLEPSEDLAMDFWGDAPVVAVEEVEITTLDRMLPALQANFGFHSPYLKLDTQGYDFEVLKGGHSSLGTVRALQTEASLVRIYQGMPGYQEVLDWLSARGFAISGLFPVTSDAEMRLMEFDCVLVNAPVSRRGRNDSALRT